MSFNAPKGLGGIATMAKALSRYGPISTVSMPRRAWGGLLLTRPTGAAAVGVALVSMPRRAWGGLLRDTLVPIVAAPNLGFQCPEGLGGDCYPLIASSTGEPLLRFNAPKGLGGIATPSTRVSLAHADFGQMMFQCPEGLGGDCYSGLASDAIAMTSLAFQCPEGLGGDCYPMIVEA